MSFWTRVTRDGSAPCWLPEVLDARPAPVPHGLLMCEGVWRDAHHVLPKRLLRREFPCGALVWQGASDGLSAVPVKRQGAIPPELEPEVAELLRPASLQELLEDERNGVAVCRRHHDLLERMLVRLKRPEIPAAVEDFAAWLGLGWWLDRSFT